MAAEGKGVLWWSGVKVSPGDGSNGLGYQVVLGGGGKVWLFLLT